MARSSVRCSQCCIWVLSSALSLSLSISTLFQECVQSGARGGLGPFVDTAGLGLCSFWTWGHTTNSFLLLHTLSLFWKLLLVAGPMLRFLFATDVLRHCVNALFHCFWCCAISLHLLRSISLSHIPLVLVPFVFAMAEEGGRRRSGQWQ
jgi:hypothetical protein